MINLRKHFSVVRLIFIIASTCVLNVKAATNEANLDKMIVYKAGAQGVNGLKDRAIAFYERNGFLPTLEQLLSAPLDDQTQVSLKGSDYLAQHYLGIIYVNPDVPGSCKGIKIQGNVGRQDGNVDRNHAYLIYTLITFNINGTWKTVCTYNEQGANANSASIDLDNCYNYSVASQLAKFNDQIKPIKAACSITE